MPVISTKNKHYYRERIRSILVQTPQTSIDGIQRRLEHDGLKLDRHYVGKLVGEIHTERARRADTWALNMALASFQDAMGEIVRVGWTIANDPSEEGRDRAAALREIRGTARSSGGSAQGPLRRSGRSLRRSKCAALGTSKVSTGATV